MPPKTPKKNNEIIKDSLLSCLSFLCGHFGKSKSEKVLVAGLAYHDNAMGPELFCEAAAKNGFRADLMQQKKLADIASAIMPCVVFLKDNQARVLMSAADNVLTLFNPETDSIERHDVADLQKAYTGHAILIRPDIVQGDTTEKGHWFWSLIRQNKSTYMLVIIASVFINLFALVSPLFIMNVYDRVIPNNAIETGWALGIGAFVAYLFDFVFRTVRGYLIDFSGRKIDVQASRRIYDHVLNMKIAGRPASSGGFANMLKDFDSVREFFTSATITALVDLPFTILFLFFVYQLGGSVAFLLVGLILIVFTVGFIIQFSLKALVQKSTKAAQTRHGILIETIHALETIKTTNADGAFRQRYSGYVAKDALHAQKSRFLSALGVNIATLMQQSASIMIVLAGMYLVQSGDMSVGGLIACVILGGRAIAPIGQIANLTTKYHQAGGALKTLNEIMSADVEREADKDFLHRPVLQGKLGFEHVSFSYPNTDIPVLRDVTFTIKPGEKVGVIGRVGSGKSTILKLLMKLYDPDNGVILTDDTDIRQIDPSDLRSNISYIGQDAKLFNGSVRDNIAASNPKASDDEVLACAKAAGVDDFMSRHPMGYDAPVGELGSALSGGQKQAIALARAMLSNPNILICDEPTNAMDTNSEQAFCQYVEKETRNKTFVLVTHKNGLLGLVDRLILVHHGKVIMDGPRDEVLAALNKGTIQVKEST